MTLAITRGAGLILFGSMLLLLPLSSFAILRGLTETSPSPPVTLLMPTLEYQLVDGDSQINANVALGNGCLRMSDWGMFVESGNKFSVLATVVDAAGPSTACTAVMSYPQHTYSIGHLLAGNYSFALTVCTVFPQYGEAVDCSNKASLVFQAGLSNSGSSQGGTVIEYENIDGHAFVNATIIVHPCFRVRAWSDTSQFGNSLSSSVTVVDDNRLMIPCIAIDTSARNSYDLGILSPGPYSFTLITCQVLIGWNTTSTDCSSNLTIFFVVPQSPAPQPSPPEEWYMILGSLSAIIIILLRSLGIPIG